MTITRMNPYHTMVADILPRVASKFQKKASDYGDVFFELGLPGQYSDMHRKMYKLRKAMWEEEELKGEQPEEILQDLIGNCLISLYLIEDDRKANQRTASTKPSSGQDTNSQGTRPGSKKGGARQQKADAVRQSAPS